MLIRRRLQRAPRCNLSSSPHMLGELSFVSVGALLYTCTFFSALVSASGLVLPDVFRFPPDHRREQALIRRPPQSGQQFREAHLHFVIASLDYVPCTSSNGGPPVTMRVRSGYADGIWCFRFVHNCRVNNISRSRRTTSSTTAVPIASMPRRPSKVCLDVRAEGCQSEEACSATELSFIYTINGISSDGSYFQPLG